MHSSLGNKSETPSQKKKVLCKEDWPAFKVGWPPEGTLDRSLVSKVRHEVIYGKLEHLDQFPYIDS